MKKKIVQFRSPIVSVTVGKVLTYNIGELSYASLNKGVSVFVIVTGNFYVLKKKTGHPE